MTHAEHQGLVVRHVKSPSDIAGLAALLRESREADVINLTSFLSDPMVTAIYSACDAVLANSGHEPFGLVGLEVMGAGGIPVTGSTGGAALTSSASSGGPKYASTVLSTWRSS